MKIVFKKTDNYVMKLLYCLVFIFFASLRILFPDLRNDLYAILLIITNLFTIIISRNNQISLFLSFLVLYFNLSICLSDYTLHINQITWNPLIMYNDGHYYSQAIFLLLLFNILFFFFINTDDYIYQPIRLEKNSALLFWSFYILLIFILVFGVSRSVSGVAYEVRINPIFEYSVIVFLLCYIFSEKTNHLQMYLIIALAVAFILQDTMYGGRITSIQLLIFLGFTYFYKWINVRNLIIFFIFAIFIFTFIGQARQGISPSVTDVLKGFVNDTSTYAYGASTTHLLAADRVDFGTRLESFAYFLLSFIFPLSGKASRLAMVSAFSNSFSVNVGGGILFSHLYFWGGFPLMLAFPIVFHKYLGKKEKSFRNMDKGILILLISYFPRLYLYTPKAGLRAALILFPILWFIFRRLEISRR